MKIIYSKKFPEKIAGFKMTEEEYRGHQEEYNGICMNCGEVRWGETEPDAQNYPCESCETNKVIGIEDLVIEGRILITEEEV